MTRAKTGTEKAKIAAKRRDRRRAMGPPELLAASDQDMLLHHRTQGFFCRAQSAVDRTRHRSGLLAARGLAREEECFLQRPRECRVRAGAADRGIRIRAAAERVALPVVHPCRDEKAIELAPGNAVGA